MQQNTQSKYGVFAFDDSGIPKLNGVESTNYTTVVIFHGFVFHKGGFNRMLEYAEKNNSCLVLVNRRDYPGSDPYTEQERKLLISEGEKDITISVNMQIWMKHRARELYEFLGLFSKNERIPSYVPSTKTGGIVLAGWSLGSSFMTATLANIQSFSTVQEGIHMKQYLRRVILYDPPYISLGYPPLLTPKFYDPLLYPENPKQTPEERGRNFATWVSGYYDHGAIAAVSDLKRDGRPEDSQRLPSIVVMSQEYKESAMYPPAGAPGGSDMILMMRGIKYGMFNALRNNALYLNKIFRDKTNSDDPKAGIKIGVGHSNGDYSGDDWSHLEVVHVLCDNSIWAMPYGMLQLKEELASAKSKGKRVRDVRFVRLEGLNHFAHWDDPEATLKAFLSNAESD